MSSITQQEIQASLDLVNRFALAYHQQFNTLIQELNNNPTPQTGRRCLRLCVEAVDMLLDNQRRLADILRQISRPAHRPAA
jgi:hypothetical protein